MYKSSSTEVPSVLRQNTLLIQRQQLTDRLANGPLDPKVVLERAKTYRLLGYADLAAADAYVALTLAETAESPDGEDLLPECDVSDDNGETVRKSWPPEGQEGLILEVKVRAMLSLMESLAVLGCLRDAWGYWVRLRELYQEREADGDDVALDVGSMADLDRFYDLIASEYRLIALRKGARDWNGKLESIASKLPNTGLSRREIYPWNNHEPDRTKPETLEVLNQSRLKEVAPLLEARLTALPALSMNSTTRTERNGFILEPHGHLETDSFNSTSAAALSSKSSTSRQDDQRTILQLGLFATKALPPGTVVLREKSLLTAMRATDVSLCDACSAPLPGLDAEYPPVACEDCDNAVFCSIDCKESATGRQGYHTAPDITLPRVGENGAGSADNAGVEDQEESPDDDSETDDPTWPFCNNDFGLDEIGRDPNSSTPADDLYFLLATRAIAMAERRGVHPLDLEEVKYLWGEFEKFTPGEEPSRTLPFSLHHNTVLPLRYLTTLLLSDTKYTPYSAQWIMKHDFWVIETLYAKFRGVASARQSTWDGKPEVAAVHWRWGLANHSCNPNIEWSWGAGTLAAAEEKDGKGVWNGEIVFRVRERRVWQKEVSRPSTTEEIRGLETDEDIWDGIRKGEEILSHYCDVELPVMERRAWAKGALGGECQCERCVWESGEAQA